MTISKFEEKIRNDLLNIDTVPKGVDWNKSKTWAHIVSSRKRKLFTNIKWYYVVASVSLIIGFYILYLVGKGRSQKNDQSRILLKEIENSLKLEESKNQFFFIDASEEDQINLTNKPKMHFTIYMVCRDC